MVWHGWLEAMKKNQKSVDLKLRVKYQVMLN